VQPARRGGRRILVGEGRIDDYTIGEKVEIPIGTATGVIARQSPFAGNGGGYLITVTNDLSRPQTIEIRLPTDVRGIEGSTLVKVDDFMLWRIQVPANGKSELRYRTNY